MAKDFITSRVILNLISMKLEFILLNFGTTRSRNDAPRRDILRYAVPFYGLPRHAVASRGTNGSLREGESERRSTRATVFFL